jgi:anti-anti-sigma factor
VLPGLRLVETSVSRRRAGGSVAGVDEQVLGPDLVVAAETDGERAVLRIKGELDAYTAPGVEEHISRLLDGGARTLVLDLSETTFLDSSGLRAILTAHRRVTEGDGAFALRAPSEPVVRLLDITGLSDHFPRADH